MFRPARIDKARAAKELRGTILTLMHIALTNELEEADPSSLRGATLVDILRSHASSGTDNMADVRGALRYLAEKGYIEVAWIEHSGDFSRVRICSRGVDLVESDTSHDTGVIFRGRR